MNKISGKVFVSLCLAIGSTAFAQLGNSVNSTITHGPILGRVSHDGIGVWIRTVEPTQFKVTCTPVSNSGESVTANGETAVDKDMTG